MGLNLDFDHVGFFDTGKRREGLTTCRAAAHLLAQLMHFRHHWQSGSVTAAMALPTGLLASLAGTERLGLPHTLGTCGLLALLAVQALLQVADGSLMGGHLRLQSGFALEKLFVLRLPIVRLPLEFDIGLLGQDHRLLRKRGGAIAVHWRSLKSGVELGAGTFHERRYNRFLRNVLMVSDESTGFAET